MAASKLNERHGVSFRMTDERDRRLFNSVAELVGEEYHRSQVVRGHLGLAIAVRRAFEEYDIDIEMPDDDAPVVTNVEGFVEEAIRRQIHRQGPGQIRENLGR